ncbi:hypothetical protein AALP_AAs58618U000100 [Arabis alpina]|uniref:PPC domain-containing protein n=1 Tax=Arabis alpina TaxID=50452 RepID=A0A087FWH8_ARAAL|nr:hypothetical protein AALP_AAs58618U000100 [Arabis alpina]
MSNGSPIHPDEIEFNVDVKSVPLAPIFIKTEKQADVIHVLHSYALKLKLGLIILSAFGFVRKVFLPLITKTTYDKEIYQIMSLSGRIVPLRMGGIDGNINLVMSDVHGRTIGGKVQHLVAETNVEVTVCPYYKDMSMCHPFDFDPPMISENPFLPSLRAPASSLPNSSDPSSQKA